MLTRSYWSSSKPKDTPIQAGRYTNCPPSIALTPALACHSFIRDVEFHTLALRVSADLLSCDICASTAFTSVLISGVRANRGFRECQKEAGLEPYGAAKLN